MQAPPRELKMSYSLNLRAGEMVEVRSKEEILATLDKKGHLDALPFMPEMLKYCGQRFKVYKRADKTCDTITGSHQSRRMMDTVHLEGLRCDGEAHGGCQALCLLFWKEAWLKRVRPEEKAGDASDAPIRTTSVCTEADLFSATRKEADPGSPEHETFSCQATELIKATSPLAWWDPRQYIREIKSGNVGLLRFIRVVAIGIFNTIQRYRGGRTYPSVHPGTLTKTPTVTLNLQPGELIQIKTRDEVIATLDQKQRNRGLWFDIEMVNYCGGQFKVAKRVEQIVDEKTGKMIKLPSDCIILENVICRGELSTNRLFCPRSLYPFWREIWLKRVDSSGEMKN